VVLVLLELVPQPIEVTIALARVSKSKGRKSRLERARQARNTLIVLQTSNQEGRGYERREGSQANATRRAAYS
jgi:hypothetical protein